MALLLVLAANQAVEQPHQGGDEAGLLGKDLLRDPWLAPAEETGAWWRLTATPALIR